MIRFINKYVDLHKGLTVRALPIAAAIFGLALVSSSAVLAQSPAPGNQSQAPSNPGAAAVSAFLADPGALLSRYPLGGGALVSDVRDLVVSDLNTVSAILAIAANATADQKNAIGAGLGLAALVLLRSNPQAGTTIQNALVRLNDKTLLEAYAAVTGNQRIGAASGAGGGGGSPGGAETATVSNNIAGGLNTPSSLYPSFGTDNFADTFTIPTFTAGGPETFGAFTTTTTVSGSVSPTNP